MARFRWSYRVLVVLAAAACAAESESDEATPAKNPIERRVEPVREQLTEADSLMRIRAQEVQDLTGS